jgi:7-cyano-7-deazaguanine synthase in queuosine biosynthesis
MPCSAGRELKQMLVNATNEMAASADALHDKSADPQQSQKRLDNARKNHTWTSSTLLEHLGRCSACRERESALRPAYKDPVKA